MHAGLVAFFLRISTLSGRVADDRPGNDKGRFEPLITFILGFAWPIKPSLYSHYLFMPPHKRSHDACRVAFLSIIAARIHDLDDGKIKPYSPGPIKPLFFVWSSRSRPSKSVCLLGLFRGKICRY